MSQQQSPIVPQQQTRTPSTPSTPLPIDPSLLRQISGGTGSTSIPITGW